MRIGSTRRDINRAEYIFLLAAWSTVSVANILKDIPTFNPLGINYDPAPPAASGPPLSAGALRDPAYLPAEIGGIVGAYVLCVAIVGIGLIIVGRRSRRSAETAARVRDIEMVVPPEVAYKFDPSPSTPGIGADRNFTWPSPDKTDRNPHIFPPSSKISIPASPPGVVDPTFDYRIVEADREMMERNLEDLYAHVMEQEDAKAAGLSPREMPLPPQLAGIGPVPPIAPQRQSSPPKKHSKLLRRPSELTIDDQKSTKAHSRSSSLISSLKSPGKRKTIRGRISSPMATPLSASFPKQASDEEPLTPKYYKPPPPVPTDQEPYYGHSRNTSNGHSISPTQSIAEKLTYDPTLPSRSITHFKTHRTNPSQTSVRSSSTQADPASATSATSQTPLYPLQTSLKPAFAAPPQRTSQRTPQPLTLHPTANYQARPQAAPATRALPFRAFDPPLASPSFTQTTKTTVLERTSPLSPGLNTAGQPRTPWSALAVPYSPYQPFTPMVPITPRLVTREERKEKKKAESKRPVLELIKSEEELWDSAY